MTINESPSDTHDEVAALAGLQPELAAIDERAVPNYNLDAVFAASEVFDAVTKTQPFMEDIARMPRLDVKPIERLPTFAHALLRANTLVLAHSPSTSTFDDDAAEARIKRESMLRIAAVLEDERLLASKKLDDIRSGTGNRDLINDLRSLHELLTPHAARLGKTELLAEVRTLADRMTHSLAQRDGEDPALAPLLAQRKKVASLLVDAYKDLQQAMVWLRRKEGDADAFAPSIYVPAGRPKAEKDPANNPAAPKPIAPVNPAAPAKPSDPRSPSDNPFDDKK